MLNHERLINEFFTMAKIPSPSKEEGRFAQYLKKVLEDIGLEVTIDDAGEKAGGNTGNIIAKLKGEENYIPLIFSAHMDTVEPCKDIMPVMEGDRIVSKSDTILSSDDKAGIAAIIEALRSIKEDKLSHGDIEVVLTICEEIGMYGAKNLNIENLKGEICYILDCDGEPGTIIKQGPAKDIIKGIFKGKKAHAGVSPEKGISAIQIAADAISNMKLLRIGPHTTANIGTCKGATPTNVVCDEVVVIAEARSLYNDKLDNQTNHMIACMKESAEKYCGNIDVEVVRSYEAFHLNELDEGIVLIQKAISNIGLVPKLISTGGGSDANVLNSIGIPSIDLGIGMSNIHTIDEFIKVEDLISTVELVQEIIKLAKK